MPSLQTAAEKCVRCHTTDRYLLFREPKNQGWLPASPNDQPPSEALHAGRSKPSWNTPQPDVRQVAERLSEQGPILDF